MLAITDYISLITMSFVMILCYYGDIYGETTQDFVIQHRFNHSNFNYPQAQKTVSHPAFIHFDFH